MDIPQILVIEDNPSTRKMYRLALENAGYAVLAAEDGRQAAELMAAHHPDLVLMDLRLPDVDGLDLLPRLRAAAGDVDVPILVITGFLPGVEQARTLQVGFTDYLFKPVEPSRLVEAVDAYLRPTSVVDDRPGKGRRILAVDDNPSQLKLLKIHLEGLGFQVVTAVDGQDALDEARNAPPDAIVSDVLMPRLDGFRLCLGIRQNPRIAHIPVLLVSTAYTDELDRKMAEEVGANGFALRTPDLQSVIRALLGLMSSTRPASPHGRVELPIEAYTHTVLNQLERQAGLNLALAQRVAWLEAQFGILAGLTQTLRHMSTLESTLDELLSHCLDAAGVSVGAAYLTNASGRLVPRAQFGLSDAARAALAGFPDRVDRLQRVLASGKPEVIRAGDDSDSDELLDAIKVNSIVITPVDTGEERLGVLVLPADADVERPWLAFAEAFSNQLGQAIALASALARLWESEDRYRRLSVELEQRVRTRTAELEAANRELEAFSYSVSHDLRAPLRAMNGFSRILMEEHAEQLGPEARRYLQLVRSGAMQMGHLVDDLLTFSRLGRQPLTRQRVLPGPLVRQVIADLLHNHSERHVDVVIGEVPACLADPALLKQVFVNLLDNALKFTGRRDKAVIEVGGRQSGSEVIYFVKDNGTGFDMRYAHKLFAVFQRLHRAEEYEGTGVGLAIVQRIAHRHGGRVWAEAAPDKGATFYIALEGDVSSEQ